jgi:Lrp/AsnC family transcriptional regulator, leucine-responsive regulatory protein
MATSTRNFAEKRRVAQLDCASSRYIAIFLRCFLQIDKSVQSAAHRCGSMQRLCMKELRLDDLDRRLLSELSRNGRLSNTELAARLPLSHSAISRRVARLEREGAIRGYGAEVDPGALGLTIRAFVGVRRDPAAPAERVAQELRAVPEVAACWIVTGEHDFLLDVRSRDMASFSDALLNRVQKVSGVVATISTFVLADIENAPGLGRSLMK